MQTYKNLNYLDAFGNDLQNSTKQKNSSMKMRYLIGIADSCSCKDRSSQLENYLDLQEWHLQVIQIQTKPALWTLVQGIHSSLH